MKTMLEFTSDAFPAQPGEEDEVNPGRHGRALAEFVAAGLAAKGFRAGTPFAEDWGWQVDVANEEFPLWIGCGNIEESANGFLVFVEPSRPFVRKWFRKIATEPAVAPLAAALHAVLADSGKVSGLTWVDTVGESLD
ncbi:MAG TPA: hypothetical protein VIT38_03465 [Allosphingosinicella sp.]